MRTILALGIAALVTAAPCLAQEGPPRAQKRADARYYLVHYWDFEPGQRDEALALAGAHFGPVSAAAGQERESAFVSLTGEWDVIVYFPLAEGPDALAWEITPTDEAWMATLAEREGGMEQAMALFDRFDQMVAREKVELVMELAPAAP